MAIHFTPAQQKVLDARDHNILVSAAAGSGKTAVLVERIVRLVSEGEHPLDIDRLLVVTFTRAAAAQMRERIGRALSARIAEDPSNAHLQRQEVLLHNAQITTMDSFFTFLLRNYFSDIDLDPGFRQIEATESGLIGAEVLHDFLEEKYAEKDPAFLRCAEYF
jgi:ATP-dependent helicase/nuclease subunit A